MAVTCPACGASNLPGDDECSSCLAPLTGGATERAEPSFLAHDTVSMLDLAAPPTVPPNTSLRQAIDAMRDHPDGCVMVVRDGRLQGIFTMRDALYRVAGKGLDLSKTPLESVMTADPQHVHTSETIGAAIHKMSVRGLRHLPVLDAADKLVGHITMTMLLRYLHSRQPAEV